MTKAELVKAAQDLLKDQRHSATINQDDQIQSGNELARAILSFFNAKEVQCPHNCRDCRETAKATGEDALYEDGA
jgi:hypothetical protein